MFYRIVRSRGTYPFHVIDHKGMPHIELTIYACHAQEFHSIKTALSYAREIVAFASWVESSQIALRQGWTLLGKPNEIRSLVSFFLTQEMKCIVAIGKDKLGFDTRRIEPTWETNRSIERLFAALRSFYGVLQTKGFYSSSNPMEGDGASDLIAEAKRRNIADFVAIHGRGPMHSDSGVDKFKKIRNSAAYFRLRGDQWTPSVIDDPTLLNTVLSAGEKWGWKLREICLVRILFDTGCRIHEACALTLADWGSGGFQKELRAISKGSHGLRVKQLFISDRTVKVLQRYVSEERSKFDSDHRTFVEFNRMSTAELTKTPIFLTRIGTAINADHFRRNYWMPALQKSKIKLRPHQVRHWFVTTALNDIHERAKSDEELQNLRNRLRQLMAWKSDMLPTYDQATLRHNLPELAHSIHIRVEAQHLAALEKKAKFESTEKQNRLKTYSQELLEEMLGK